MYRTSAKRLLAGVNSNTRLRFPYTLRFSTNIDPQSFTQQNPNHHQNPQSHAPNHSDSTTSSSSSGNWSTSSSARESRSHHEHQRHRIEYEDEQARVLQASLAHVVCTLTLLPKTQKISFFLFPPAISFWVWENFPSFFLLEISITSLLVVIFALLILFWVILD